MAFNVNGYKFRQSNSIIFIFTLFSIPGSALKGRNFLLFPFKADPILEALYYPGTLKVPYFLGYETEFLCPQLRRS